LSLLDICGRREDAGVTIS